MNVLMVKMKLLLPELSSDLRNINLYEGSLNQGKLIDLKAAYCSSDRTEKIDIVYSPEVIKHSDNYLIGLILRILFIVYPRISKENFNEYYNRFVGL